MVKSIQILSACLLVVLVTSCQTSKLQIPEFTHQSVEEEVVVSDLLARMSLAQKVGQMVQAEIKEITPKEARDYALGSVLNGGGSFPYNNKHASRDEWLSLAEAFYQATGPDYPDHVPILWGTDAVHGHNNRFGAPLFPHNVGLGAANNPTLTKEVFAATALDVQSTGIKWVFAPTVAVAQNLRWGRAYESFSENPAIVTQLAGIAVVSMQGESPNQLAEPGKVIATAKHFIGDGGTQDGIDQGDTIATKKALMQIHGASFQQAIDQGVETVMASFSSWNGEKVHGHRYLLSDVLKGEMGFDGFVIGDWNAHAQIPGCSKESCAHAINAGVDMLMAPKDWKALIANTIEDVNSGKISLARINDANRRILSVKFRAGLFNTDYANPKALVASDDIESMDARHREIARQAVRESLVLLKNNQKSLPIPPQSHVLLVGNAANSIATQSGGWSLTWQGDGTTNADFPGGTSILQAFEKSLSPAGGHVTYMGIEELITIINDDNVSDWSELSSELDTVVFVYGENPYAEGAGDLTELRPPNKLNRYANAMALVQAQEIPVVSILMAGRPLSVNRFINASDAFVMAWLPGTEALGITDVLVANNQGKAEHDFKGKLPFAWPRAASPLKTDGSSDTPQFPIGYGASYSEPRQLAALVDHDSSQMQDMVVDGNLPIFVKRVSEPWSLYVGDEDNWSVSVDGNSGSTVNNETLTVSPTDNMTQEDARKLRWSALRYAQFYFQYQQGVDISKLAQKDGALTFKVKVETPPDDAVELRMDCHYPCMGQIDFTGFLKALPENEWQTVSIDLDCFAAKGAELTHINTPFLLGTSGKLALEIADISIQTAVESGKKFQCAQSLAQTSEL